MLDDATKHRFLQNDYRTKLAVHMSRVRREDDVVSKQIFSEEFYFAK